MLVHQWFTTNRSLWLLNIFTWNYSEYDKSSWDTLIHWYHPPPSPFQCYVSAVVCAGEGIGKSTLFWGKGGGWGNVTKTLKYQILLPSVSILLSPIVALKLMDTLTVTAIIATLSSFFLGMVSSVSVIIWCIECWQESWLCFDRDSRQVQRWKCRTKLKRRHTYHWLKILSFQLR